MTTTQVRTFTLPQPLGERLAEPILNNIPRTIPEIPELPQRRESPKVNGDYTRVPMANYNEPKKEGGITFAAQDTLPKLPIPELELTCQRYLESLNPLQTPRERAETEHAVREFLRHDGPELQEKLKQYAQGKTSYIEQFCKLTPHPILLA